MKPLIALFVLLVPFASQARDLRLIYKNNRAVDLFKNEKRQEAFEQFLGLTAKAPEDATLKFNMAAALQALGEEEKAIKLNASVLKDIDALLKTASESEQQELLSLKFATLFNMGVSHQVMQNIDQALAHYQGALALIPDSKEIKTNIEMMFAGGSGKGKGKNKDKQQGGQGEGDPSDGQDEGDDEGQDQPKDQDGGQKEKEQQQQQQGNKPKGFDQKYMSNEDLKRIMEELNDQEQKIRAKMERKGGKSAPKDKEW